MRTKHLFTTLIFLLLIGTSFVFADVVVVIKGGKTNDDGSVTYRIVETRTDNNGNLRYKECRGRGPNTCPKSGVVFVGSIEINIEEDIYPVIISELKNGNTTGTTIISGISVNWKDAELIGDDYLECEITIKE